MNKVLIKICGITKPDDAEMAAKAGADFIGMIFDKKSPRNVSIDQAILISKAAKHAGVSSVGVFTTQSKEEMEKIAKTAGLDYLQLHTPYSILQGSSLQYKRFFVQTPYSDLRTLENFQSETDLILYDSHEGGSGKVIDWSAIRPPINYKWFLAGGLNPRNISEAVRLLKPFGVDVSSGVENGVKGQKDFKLVNDFINTVNTFTGQILEPL